MAENTTSIEHAHKMKSRMVELKLATIQKLVDMDLSSFRFHHLVEGRKKRYAVKMDKNWQFIFKFDGTDVYDAGHIESH